MHYSVPVDTPFFENWVTQLRKGMLELCILNSMNGRRLYGYDIVKSLRETDGLVISEGTIYPILSRLHREGLVTTQLEESAAGPPRKYYELTKPGQHQLARMNEYWETIEEGIDQLRKGPKP
jgi:PadR family transcriptional regulator, regulatory protein PadR